MTHSETLFEQAQKYIPGGVNSPVRAFRGVVVRPFSSSTPRAPTCTTKTTSATSITSVPGAHDSWPR